MVKVACPGGFAECGDYLATVVLRKSASHETGESPTGLANPQMPQREAPRKPPSRGNTHSKLVRRTQFKLRLGGGLARLNAGDLDIEANSKAAVGGLWNLSPTLATVPSLFKAPSKNPHCVGRNAFRWQRWRTGGDILSAPNCKPWNSTRHATPKEQHESKAPHKSILDKAPAAIPPRM